MSEYAKLVISVDSTQIQSADRDLRGIGQTSNTVSSELQRLASVAKTVGAALAVRQVAGYADTWSDLTSRVRLSIGAHESAALVMSRLSDVARGTYSSLESTAESFAQNSVTLRALGKSTLDQLDYTEALNNALVVSGAKADRAQMVQNSLSKAMAEGTLRGQELNNVLNSGSRVAELLADELGINITQLRGVASEGKLTGDVIYNSLTKNMETLKKEAESMPATIADGFLLIRNAALESVGVFDQHAGISEELAEKLVTVSDAIREIDWASHADGVKTATTVTAAYLVAVNAVPVGLSIAAASTKAYTAVMGAATAANAATISSKLADIGASRAQAAATALAAKAELEFLRLTQASLVAQLQSNVSTAQAASLRLQLAANTRALTATQGVYTTSTAAASAATTAKARSVALLTTGLSNLLTVAASFYAGWQIGDYLRNEFEIVEKAGIALMSGLHQVAIRIGSEFSILGERIKFALTNPFSFARDAIADYLEWVAGLGAGTLKFLGLEGLADSIKTEFDGVRGATAAEHNALIIEMRENSRREAGLVSGIYAEMFADVGKGSEKATGPIEDLAGEVEGLGDSAVTATKQQQKALSDLLAQSALSIKSANDMADAYLKGANGVRALTIQQKIEEQLLKTGASARSAVTKALNEQQNAIDRLDVAKQIADLRTQNADLKAQTSVVLANTKSVTGGADAQRAYNIAKGVTAALADKNADALGDETDELRRQLGILEDSRRELEAHNRIAGLIDSTATAQEKLNRELQELDELMKYAKTPEQMAAVQRAMKDARDEASQWAQWTESSLERVDSAFADAWRNIGDGFSSFRDSLTNGFKQMLAELAHLAITRPIIMQIGASMGIGGGTQGNNGIWGSLGGGGSGGSGLLGMAQQGYGIYQAATGQGLIGSVVSGYQAGGLAGAWGGATGWGRGVASGFGGMFGGGAAASGAVGAGTGFGLGQSLVSGQVGSAGYAGAGSSLGGGTATTWGGAASGLGSVLGGLGGAYAGYQQGGWGGAAVGGAAGWGGATLGTMAGAAAASAMSGTAMGAAMGSIVPGIGTAIGAVLGTLLAGSLMGGGERFKTTVGSATGYYGDEGYTSTGPDASFYPGKRQFGDEHDAALDGLNDAFTSMLGGLFDVFDVDSTVSSTIQTRLRRTSGKMASSLFVEIDGAITRFGKQYSKDGKLGEAMEQFADDIMGEFLAKTIVDSALPEHLRKQFEGLTEAEEVAETLAGVIGRFEGVNAVLDTVNLALLETTNAGLIAGDTIIALAGGLEALQANTSVYYDRFFSEQEKIEDTLESVTRAFETADITLAGSREAYRAMVEDIDVTTEAGQSMFATMMALAGQADQYYSILEQTGNALIQTAGAMFGAAMGEAGAAFSALQRSITNEQQKAQAAHNARLGSLNDMLATTSSRIGDMGRISSMLDAALKRLRGTSDDAARSLRAQAVMTLNSALVTARSGQSLEGVDGLQDALDIAAQMDTALYSSLEDFEREQGRTANLISELEKVNGKQLTTEEQMLAALEVQISAAQEQYELEMLGLSAQLEAAQRQIDALNGVDNSIMSLAQALDRMSSAVEAAQAAQAAAAKAAAQRPVENAVDQLYRDILGREADAGGRDYWVSQLDSGTLNLGNIGATMGHSALNNANTPAEELRNASNYLGIPGFASGGMHSGGWRIVGEQGPELELTGPSRIYSAGQTAAMLQGGDNAATVSELRQLRDTFHSGMRQLAKFMEQTATSTRQMNQSGVQIVGTVETREVAV